MPNVPKAISIHLGVADVDHRSYAKPPAPLHAPERDAMMMADLATRQRMDVRPPLLGQAATRARLQEELDTASAELHAGSLLVLTFAGHGAQVANRAPDPARPPRVAVVHSRVGDEADGRDEDDGLDEAWCLWDGFFLDDELHDALAKFRAGVRILVCSDSCHGGSMLEAPLPPGLFPREYLPWAAGESYAAREVEYEERRAAIVAAPVPARPSVIHLGACGDAEVAFESEVQGVFTNAFVHVWDHGGFQGGHRELLAAIAAEVGDVQHPCLTFFEPLDETFATMKPFTW